MFFKPLKFEQSVISPPAATKEKAEQIFNTILQNYRANYDKFKQDPQGNLVKDPWFRREAWRWDPFYSKANVLKHSFPGLGIAAAAFSIYLIYDLISGENSNTENINFNNNK